MAACRSLRDAMRGAPLAVRVSPAQRRSLGDPSKQPMLRLLTGWVAKHCQSEPLWTSCRSPALLWAAWRLRVGLATAAAAGK